MPYLLGNPELGSLSRLDLIVGESYSIGRSPDSNDFAVLVDSASRNHANLGWSENSDLWIEDLDSLNGLYVNNVKVNHHKLSYGDRLSFGQPDGYHYVYCEHKTVHQHSMASNQFEFSLEHHVTVGRGTDNDIILFGEATASQKHAEIFVVRGECWVADQKSTNGTWINGKRIKREKVLVDDVVFIASSLIRITLKSNRIIISLSKWRNSVQLECVSLNKIVGKGLKILNDVTLSIQPGEFVGILGPSGAGKSTLLKALNGFSPPTSGAVLLNEVTLFKSYDLCKHIIGYVPQDDVIGGDLSVYKTLFYVAALRLPNDQTNKEITTLVDKTLKMLRLEHVSNATVGSLSGGQRKRVSVGAELLTEPALLFLDEPTSGLDPSTEEKLMRYLRDMSRGGTTTLITTHILYNLEMLDKVIFLSRGRVTFYGTPREALNFFQVAGKSIDKPIEIFDLLEGELNAETGDKVPTMDVDVRPTIAAKYNSDYVESQLFKKHVIDNLSDFAKRLYTAENGKIDSIESPKELTDLLKTPLSRKKHKFSRFIPTFKELTILTARNFRTKFAVYKKLQLYLMVPILLGLISLSNSNPGFPNAQSLADSKNLIQHQVQNGPSGSIDQQLVILLSGINTESGKSGADLIFKMRHETIANLPISLSTLLILTMTAIFCGTLSACLELSSERNIYLRERMAGQKTINYLLSKIPFLCLLTAIQMVVLVFICSFDANFRQIGLVNFTLCLIAVSWASISLGLLASSLDPSNGQYSVVIAIALILPQLLLSGALGPDYYAGMSSLTKAIANVLPARWGTELLMDAAFQGKQSLSWIEAFVSKEMGLNFDYMLAVRVHLVLALQALLYLSLSFYILEKRTPL